MNKKEIKEKQELINTLFNENEDLQRMWYKLNKDKVEYTDKERLLKKIDEHFNQYYDDLKSMSLNFIDKISFNIFKISKKLWTNTIGTLYFSLIRKIKYR